MPERIRDLNLPFLILIAVLTACGESETVESADVETQSDQSESAEGNPRDTVQQAEPVLLEVAVWDETNRRAPSDRMEVWVKGHGSWYPNLEYGSDKKGLGEFPIGEQAEFFVYPDGRDGTEIRVPFEMTGEMISGSAMSQMMVTLFDDGVKIVGQAIPDRSVEYDR